MSCWRCISINPWKENQLDALFILSLFGQSTSTCFGHICSPSSGGILYIYATNGTCCVYTVHQIDFHYMDVSTVVKILRNTELINNIVMGYEIITELFMKVLLQLFLVILRHSVEIPSWRTGVSYGAYRHKSKQLNIIYARCTIHTHDFGTSSCQWRCADYLTTVTGLKSLNFRNSSI